MALLETISGLLQQDNQKTTTILRTTAPVPPLLGSAPPSFVGENYFCESGNPGPFETQWYLDDPLWDSQGCASGSSCCGRGGPWFTTILGQEVSDDIEVRMCKDEVNENVGLEVLEIYAY